MSCLFTYLWVRVIIPSIPEDLLDHRQVLVVDHEHRQEGEQCTHQTDETTEHTTHVTNEGQTTVDLSLVLHYVGAHSEGGGAEAESLGFLLLASLVWGSLCHIELVEVMIILEYTKMKERLQ